MFDYLLNSKTLTKKRCEIYQNLCKIIGTASYIVGVDADLGDIVINFFKTSLDLNPYVIHNKYQNALGEVTQYKCENKIIANMKAKLKIDEKFICCSDSKTKQDKIICELKDYCQRNNLKRDFLIYSSTDGKEEDLEDVDTSWDNKYVFILQPFNMELTIIQKKRCVFMHFSMSIYFAPWIWSNDCKM